MNTLRRTSIYLLALAAGMALYTSPALALSKADRSVLEKINTRAQTFLGAVQANQTAALKVKGQWVARTQENNKACQNAMLEQRNSDTQIPSVSLSHLYFTGKYYAVNYTLRGQWISYFRSLRELRSYKHMQGTSKTLGDYLDSYIKGVAQDGMMFPLILKSSFDADTICDAAEAWQAAGWTSAATPQLVKDTLDDFEWLNVVDRGYSGYRLAGMLRQAGLPVSVRKLVGEGYTGIPVMSYDPVAQAEKQG